MLLAICILCQAILRGHPRIKEGSQGFKNNCAHNMFHLFTNLLINFTNVLINFTNTQKVVVTCGQSVTLPSCTLTSLPN